MQCPACLTTSLDADGACEKCQGAWLDEAQLRARATNELEISNPEHSDLACPVCGQRMVTVLVFDVPIDKCVAHGMWFERSELAEVLHRSRNDAWRLYGGVNLVPPDNNPDWFLYKLANLFRKRGS